MTQYVGILLWLAFCTAVTQLVCPSYSTTLYGLPIKRVPKYWAIVIALPLIYWAAIRSNYRFDTGTYATTFSKMPVQAADISAYVANLRKDKGFYFLASVIHVFISKDSRVYFGIIASIQAFFLFRLFRKYSTNYILSVFIFVASTDYLSWMHNGIRQFMAVAIILAGMDYIVNRKYLQAIAIILVASLFHASALLMLPILFIIQGKPWNIRTLLVIVAAAVAIVFVGRFTDILDDLLSDTQYTNVVSDWEKANDNGTNPLRVLVYAMPMLLSIVGYKQIEALNHRVINVAVNMSIITTVLYAISMVTSGIFIGRLPIYTSIISTCVLLPWEIDNIFEKGTSKLMKLSLVGAYLLFYYYQCHRIWRLF